MRKERVNLLIIGSGPAGYTAAIYAARADLKPVMITGMQPGGQLTQTTDVENYPGYPDGVLGTAMMEDFRKQAEKFGTDIRFGYATKVHFGHYHQIIIDDEYVIETEAVIIATGAQPKYLGLESEQRLLGHGVSACATCDGFFYRGQTVAVIGGGDTACEEATHLAHICQKVYMLVRGEQMRASKAMQNRVAITPNIEILFNCDVTEVIGSKEVTGIKVLNNLDETMHEMDISGLFVAIGHHPNSDIFKGHLELDNLGYIKTKPGSALTSVPGVFAAGDVQDRIYRQAITSAGSGCMAALDAERYLSTVATTKMSNH